MRFFGNNAKQQKWQHARLQFNINGIILHTWMIVDCPAGSSSEATGSVDLLNLELEESQGAFTSTPLQTTSPRANISIRVPHTRLTEITGTGAGISHIVRVRNHCPRAGIDLHGPGLRAL